MLILWIFFLGSVREFYVEGMLFMCVEIYKLNIEEKFILKFCEVLF